MDDKEEIYCVIEHGAKVYYVYSDWKRIKVSKKWMKKEVKKGGLLVNTYSLNNY